MPNVLEQLNPLYGMTQVAQPQPMSLHEVLKGLAMRARAGSREDAIMLRNILRNMDPTREVGQGIPNVFRGPLAPENSELSTPEWNAPKYPWQRGT